MLSLYEILKASKTGIATDMWTALAGMNWGGADSGHEVKELTGIPPLSFRADGTPLLDYLISGNMTQTGTPTPQNPIQPSECGELETIGAKAGQYKIPISSANTTTPVYLGEVETTRRVKKLVLTGKEADWIKSSKYQGSFYNAILYTPANTIPILCSHAVYTSVINGTAYVYGKCCVDGTGYKRNLNLYIGESSWTVDEFKAYLAQQYANGTPVTIWYVLATETTGIVNEPLRKIGEYADTLSMEQAGVQIPTVKGNTVIDVETTLKPSEMYIKYQE